MHPVQRRTIDRTNREQFRPHPGGLRLHAHLLRRTEIVRDYPTGPHAGSRQAPSPGPATRSSPASAELAASTYRLADGELPMASGIPPSAPAPPAAKICKATLAFSVTYTLNGVRYQFLQPHGKR